MDVYELSKKLESKGFKVFYTNTIAETRGLLTELIGRTDTVGAGGSATLDEIGIGEALKERGNTVYIRRLMPDVNPDEVMKKAVFADWFLTSTNALTEDGEFVNVDGNCNRIASMLYGGKNTVFVLGVNKIVKTCPPRLNVSAPSPRKRTVLGSDTFQIPALPAAIARTVRKIPTFATRQA